MPAKNLRRAFILIFLVSFALHFSAAAATFWSFQKPVPPVIPAVKNKKWAETDIDRLILAGLEEKNLQPAKPADKRTLIRRATFDLTGLPPTPQEVEAFLKDSSPDAFAKVVDRLLASPHYGERWGRHWLDVVRYADSLDARGIGSEGDIAEAWRYRDWVVNAFNRNLPYDQFITQQIAGDLLPVTPSQDINTNAIIATGMYAIGNWGNGDADKDKILTDIADDQVDVTSRAFLGLTMACARCHDHKFDPITTADYYSMAGIFFSSHILPKLTPKGAGEILARFPLASEADLAERKRREARLAELQKQIDKITDEQIAALSAAVRPDATRYLAAAQSNAPAGFHPQPAVLKAWVNYLGLGPWKLLGKLNRDIFSKPGVHALNNPDADNPSVTVNSTDEEVSFLTVKLPAHTLAVHPSPQNGVAVGWKSPITGKIRITGRVADADPNCGDGIAWTVDVVGRRLADGSFPNGGVQNFSDGNGAENLAAVAVEDGDMLQLAVLPKENYSCDSTIVELEIAEIGGQKRVWNLTREVVPDFYQGANPHPDTFGHAQVWHFYDLTGARPSMKELLRAAAASPTLNLDKAPTNSPLWQLSEDLKNPRSTFWSGLRGDMDNFSPEARATLASLKNELASLEQHPPPTLAMAHGLAEGGVPESPHAGIHDVAIHIRGRYDHLGPVVPRGFPKIIAGENPPVLTTNESGRLELARWITSPENPLTARVMVNRIWQHHFGEGIVRTPNNFGKLGTPPTNQKLLDYLACEFMKSGWSIKAMHRAIMLSATYQQSSVPLPATFKADPDNLLFGHMNRQRLEAEALRDNLLSAAGNLDLTMTGPSIRDLTSHRRTLYVMTVRSDRATYQALFDCADPTAIVEKRINSTVSPQALFMLNNPFVLDQCNSLASRMLREGPKKPREQIAWLYQLLFSRPPTSDETKIALAALQRLKSEDPTASAESAWQQYCQILLCSNESIYTD